MHRVTVTALPARQGIWKQMNPTLIAVVAAYGKWRKYEPDPSHSISADA